MARALNERGALLFLLNSMHWMKQIRTMRQMEIETRNRSESGACESVSVRINFGKVDEKSEPCVAKHRLSYNEQ